VVVVVVVGAAVVTEDRGVCVSCRLTQVYCAKMAEQFTLGGPRNIVLDGGPDLPQQAGEELGKLLAIVDPLHISEWLKLHA